MNNFFKFDGKFFKYGTLFADLMILTLLWTITSLPIITIGASTTAMYYVTTRQISNREGYVSKDFFRSFKENFFQATGVTLVFAVILAVLFLNINYLPSDSILFPMQFVLLAIALSVLVFVFPILARFRLSFIGLLATSLSMAASHIFTSITCLVLLGAIYFVVMRYPMIFVVCVGVYGYLTSLMFMRIFKKQLPEMDTDAYDEKKRMGMLDEDTEEETSAEEV